MNAIRTTLGLVTVLGLPGCTDYPREVGAYGGNPYAYLYPPWEVRAPSERTTWHGDVRPLVERHCVRCHRDGGVGPMPLDTFEATDGYRESMVAYVESGHMPPWSFDASCRELASSRALSAAEREAFVDWRAAGFLPGADSDYVAPQPPGPPDTPTGIEVPLGRAPFTPTGDGARCFLLEQKITSNDTLDARGWWVTGLRIDPDREDLVQQATLYLIAPEDASLVPADDGGYPCELGAGTPREVALVAWVPGAAPLVFSQESALLVPFGARFAMRVQYRTNGRQDLPADATSATLWRLEGRRAPAVAQVRAHALGAATGDDTVFLPHSETIFALTPEPSEAAASLALSYPGSPAICLARADDWAPGWQETLHFAADQRVILDNPVTFACSDSAGAPLPGCRVHVLATAPLYDSIEPLGQTCSGVQDCTDACAGTTTCLIDCLAWEVPACGDCALAQLRDETCAGSAPRPCEEASCAAHDDYAGWLACMLERCRTELGILQESFTSALESGRCNRDAEPCLYFE